MSNLPLQPMTTAPREGSWIWCVFSQSMVRVRWEAECQRWRSGHFTYTDEEFSGWLDIEAAQRDAERYRFIRDHSTDYELLNNTNPNSKRQKWAFKRRFTSYPYDIFETVDEAVDATRAAIDKEMGRG